MREIENLHMVLIYKKQKKLSSFLGIVLYRILLDIIYMNMIIPIFGYEGYTGEFNLIKYIVSWLVLLVFIPSIVRKNEDQVHPSSLIVLLLSLVIFVPFTTMMAYGYFTAYYCICNIIYWFFLFAFYKVFLHIRLFKFKQFKNSINNFIISIIGFVFFSVVVYISWRYTGFRFTFDLFSVYELRSQIFNLPIVLEYLFAASKAVNPILMVYALSRKNYFVGGLITIIQFLSFGINGMKSVFFITVFMILGYIFYKDSYKNKIPWIFVVFSLVTLIENLVFKTYYSANLIIRRMMFLTNRLNYYYFDFFTNNSPDYFRQSFLRYFGVTSPYGSIDHVIGKVYFNKPSMGANSGLISDAMANLGLIGILIMPLFLAFVFRIFDECTRGLDKKLYIVLYLYVIYVFISSFLFTSLLTHGILAMCILLYLLPRDNVNLNLLKK